MYGGSFISLHGKMWTKSNPNKFLKWYNQALKKIDDQDRREKFLGQDIVEDQEHHKGQSTDKVGDYEG